MSSIEDKVAAIAAALHGLPGDKFELSEPVDVTLDNILAMVKY